MEVPEVPSPAPLSDIMYDYVGHPTPSAYALASNRRETGGTVVMLFQFLHAIHFSPALNVDFLYFGRFSI